MDPVRNKIWSYWEGPKPIYIDWCIRAMQNVYGDRFVLLTPENLDQYLPGHMLDPRYLKLPEIAVKCCCIRAAIICKHGGWWMDADTMPIEGKKPPNPKNFLHTTWNRNRVVNGYFAAPPKNKTVVNWVNWINHTLEFRKDEVERGGWWGKLGETLLTPSVLMYGGHRIPRHWVIPADFNESPSIFLRLGSSRRGSEATSRGGNVVTPSKIWKCYVDQDTICFGLNNSWLMHNLDMDRLADRIANVPGDQSVTLIAAILKTLHRLAI